MTPTCEGIGKGIWDGYFYWRVQNVPGGATMGTAQGIFHLCDFGIALYFTVLTSAYRKSYVEDG